MSSSLRAAIYASVNAVSSVLNLDSNNTGPAPTRSKWVYHLGSTGLCIATALVAWPLANWLDLANIVMLFLLAVALAATFFGRYPAILAAFLSVALFDFFFVPPRFSFAVNDAQYVVTFAVMLVVALIIGQLTTALKRRADEARSRAAEQANLYDLARILAGALTLQQTANATSGFVMRQLGARATILLPDAEGKLQPTSGHNNHDIPTTLSATERTAACAVYDSSRKIDSRDLGRDDGERLLLPLVGATRNRGVLLVTASDQSCRRLSDHDFLLGAVASLLATAIERLHYVEVASRTELEVQAERLRSGILAALSHDVRTPLTAMYGLADTLASDDTIATIPAHETAIALRDQALQLSGMVTNLLDMARIQAGKVALRREWQPLDEVVGASIRFAAPALKGRKVIVNLAAGLPLVNIDAVLIERVLCNLLENAAKYSPDDADINLDAHANDEHFEVSVSNQGRGFPPDRLEHVFTLFERGGHEGHASGMGVGLAICRAIVEAHGGRIHASNIAGGGAQVTFVLPRGAPPRIDLETESTRSIS